MISFVDFVADIFDFFTVCFQCELVLYTLAIMTFCIVLQIFKNLTTARAVAV